MSMFDSRKNERHEFLDYKVEFTLNHFSHAEIFEADVLNANETGICILSSCRLDVGQEITLRNFMSFSNRTAEVIWIAEDEETGGFDKSDQVLFKVGLQFLD